MATSCHYHPHPDASARQTYLCKTHGRVSHHLTSNDTEQQLLKQPGPLWHQQTSYHAAGSSVHAHHMPPMGHMVSWSSTSLYAAPTELPTRCHTRKLSRMRAEACIILMTRHWTLNLKWAMADSSLSCCTMSGGGLPPLPPMVAYHRAKACKEHTPLQTPATCTTACLCSRHPARSCAISGRPTAQHYTSTEGASRTALT